MKNKNGFTLIELLVVISIIALLLSIIMPALAKVKRQARKTICASRIKQCMLAATIAAVDDPKERLPSAGIHSETPYVDVDDAISIEFKEFLKIGNAVSGCSTGERASLDDTIAKNCGEALIKSGAMDIFSCPEVQMKRVYPNGEYDLILEKFVYKFPNITYLGSYIVARIGYNYYAGYETKQWPALPSDYVADGAVEWNSADRLSDSGRNVLMSDRTRWVPRAKGWEPEPMTEIAHTRRGYLLERGVNLDPREEAGAGGNIGYLDGSVDFVQCSKTQPRQNNYTGTGVFDIYSYSFF